MLNVLLLPSLPLMPSCTPASHGVGPEPVRRLIPLEDGEAASRRSHRPASRASCRESSNSISESYGPGGAAISSAHVPAPLLGAGIVSAAGAGEGSAPSSAAPCGVPRIGCDGGGKTPGPLSCASVDVAHDAQQARDGAAKQCQSAKRHRVEEDGGVRLGPKWRQEIPNPTPASNPNRTLDASNSRGSTTRRSGRD